MIFPRLAALLCLSFIPAIGWPANTAVLVTLKKEAGVSGKYFSLGDIAEVNSTDLNAQMAVAHTRLGLVPPIGYPMTVSSARIRRRLESDAVAGQYRIVFSGADSIILSCRAKRVNTALIVASARQALMRYLTSLVPGAVAIDLQPSDEPGSLNLPAGDVTTAFRLGPSPVLAKRMPVWVDIAIDGNRYRTVLFWFNVSVRKTVLEATRHLNARENLVRGDVKRADRNIAGLTGVPLAATVNIAALRTTHAMSTDTVVLADSVEPKPMVEPLEPVSVTVAVGSVRIRTQGVAEAEGRAGDLIRIRNPDSHQTYVARVVGPDSVVVSSE